MGSIEMLGAYIPAAKPAGVHYAWLSAYGTDAHHFHEIKFAMR
jgi:uncharacterized protein (DUF488 family)